MELLSVVSVVVEGRRTSSISSAEATLRGHGWRDASHRQLVQRKSDLHAFASSPRAPACVLPCAKAFGKGLYAGRGHCFSDLHNYFT